jgi:multidrug transporter EmrE-like cation transporter
MSFTLTQALLGHDNVTTLGSILCFTLLNVLTKRLSMGSTYCSHSSFVIFGIGLVWSMVFNVTFNNFSVISWRLVLLVEETGVPGENHRPVASH